MGVGTRDLVLYLLLLSTFVGLVLLYEASSHRRCMSVPRALLDVLPEYGGRWRLRVGAVALHLLLSICLYVCVCVCPLGGLVEAGGQSSPFPIIGGLR